VRGEEEEEEEDLIHEAMAFEQSTRLLNAPPLGGRARTLVSGVSLKAAIVMNFVRMLGFESAKVLEPG